MSPEMESTLGQTFMRSLQVPKVYSVQARRREIMRQERMEQEAKEQELDTVFEVGVLGSEVRPPAPQRSAC